MADATQYRKREEVPREEVPLDRRKGNMYIIGCTSSAAVPSLTEYPVDKDTGIHKNTTDGRIYLAYNSSGTIKKVELT